MRASMNHPVKVVLCTVIRLKDTLTLDRAEGNCSHWICCYKNIDSWSFGNENLPGLWTCCLTHFFLFHNFFFLAVYRSALTQVMEDRGWHAAKGPRFIQTCYNMTIWYVLGSSISWFWKTSMQRKVEWADDLSRTSWSYWYFNKATGVHQNDASY